MVEAWTLRARQGRGAGRADRGPRAVRARAHHRRGGATIPHLRARGVWADIDHPRRGQDERARLADPPARRRRRAEVARPAPLLGQDTDRVLSGAARARPRGRARRRCTPPERDRARREVKRGFPRGAALNRRKETAGDRARSACSRCRSTIPTATTPRSSRRTRRPSCSPTSSASREAFVGEHFSSWSERITSPLIFLATLIPRTTQIRFGTGVINLPQLHPATVAAHAAMFDHLCRGRFIMGIGPGGLVSDLEMFDVGQAELRPQMVLESIDAIQRSGRRTRPTRSTGASGRSRSTTTSGRSSRWATSRAPTRSRTRRSRCRSSRRTRQRADGGRARVDPRLRPVLPPPLPARALGEVRRGVRSGRPATRSRTCGASHAASSSRRATPRPRTTSPIPTTGSRSTTASSTTASRGRARRCSC